MSIEVLWLVLAVVLVCVGVAGSVLPALPGVPLVFAGLLLAAWAGDFQQVTWIPLVVLGLLTVISFVIDFAATALGAKRVGATKLAVLGAALGTLGGLGLAGELRCDGACRHERGQNGDLASPARGRGRRAGGRRKPHRVSVSLRAAGLQRPEIQPRTSSLGGPRKLVNRNLSAMPARTAPSAHPAATSLG